MSYVFHVVTETGKKFVGIVKSKTLERAKAMVEQYLDNRGLRWKQLEMFPMNCRSFFIGEVV